MYKTKTNPNSHVTTTTANSLLPTHHHHHHKNTAADPPPDNCHSHAQHHHRGGRPAVLLFMFSQPIMLAFTTWLRTRRSRCLFLLLCSPILLPLLCASFPFLCFAELCLCLCRCCRGGRRRREYKRKKTASHGGGGEEEEEEQLLRRCEEGMLCGGCQCGDQEVGLLQRYLEDQLRLVVGSVYECGGDDFLEEEEGEEDTLSVDSDSNINTPLLG
ncbi:hypothetical protein Tsubulata_043220 [Turnera subulata]|uniref:Uncharacterized protein n=1 Tax=Turnera subulata TaxID=218843 RepID=A0A9Q0FP81_9ROSI|nr:hypothetical protein Tsubulata_043220 [Turnera subulata]